MEPDVISTTMAGSPRAEGAAVAANRPALGPPLGRSRGALGTGSRWGRSSGPPRSLRSGPDGAADGPTLPKIGFARSGDGLRTAKDAPKPPQEAPERTPTREKSSHSLRKMYMFGLLAFWVCTASKTATDAPETAPTRTHRPQDGPRTAQESPKTAPEGAKTAQERPQRAPRGSQESPEGAGRGPRESFRGLPESPDTSRVPQDGPGGPQDGSGAHTGRRQDNPGRPKQLRQSASRTSQQAPKRAPGEPLS